MYQIGIYFSNGVAFSMLLQPGVTKEDREALAFDLLCSTMAENVMIYEDNKVIYTANNL